MEIFIVVGAFALCVVGLNRLNNWGYRRRYEPWSKDSRWQ